MAEDTIVGVATGTPDGGVAIVRISGAEAAVVASAVCERSLGPRRQLVRRKLRLGQEATCVGEDALVVWMPGPRSFTGEDVVEFHVHGGQLNVQSVVGALVRQGCRVAGAGEFSRRAFVNGCLSLDEAEGLAAVIGARTEEELRRGRRLMSGELGREVREFRGRLQRVRIEMEALLDFPEDVDESLWRGWDAQLKSAVSGIDSWLASFEGRRAGRGEFRVVIAGPTNAGKSSLFNRLLDRDRAIVAAMPGTTRDFVEAQWWLEDGSVVLVDTAGIRSDTDGDGVEAIGIGRSVEQYREADCVLWLEASDQAGDDRALVAAREELSGSGAEVVWVESKRDLGCERVDWMGVGAGGSTDLEALCARVMETRRQHRELADSAWVGLDRHRRLATDVRALLREALDGCARRLEPEIVAFVVGSAESRLAEMVGEELLGAVGDGVLDGIFSKFCIGK